MTTILHQIKVFLYDNLLTEDPYDFSARVSSERSLSTLDVSNSAATRGGADISARSMAHAAELFFTEMAYLLCDGYAINTGWFTVSVKIKGVFNSPNDRFDPERHSIVFEFQQGEKLRKEIPSIQVNVMGVADTNLSILQVEDIKTGSVNDVITPNRNLRIIGYKLKIMGEDASNGIYFINQATQERTKVDATDIAVNNPSELLIIIPQLEAGTYQLEISNQFSGSAKPLKELRTTQFKQMLTVQ